MICASSVLALLGLQAAANRGLNSTHWGGKVTRQNLARRGERGGGAKLSIRYEGQEYSFAYHNRAKSPHEAFGPEGELAPDIALQKIGVDVRAVSFLTTTERRPPWMTLEGDGKTPDIRTVLRQSLETSLATHVDGCKGVQELIGGEASNLETEIQGLNEQLDDIVGDWISAGALAEIERTRIPSAECVETRLGTLTDLGKSLGVMYSLVSRLRDLETIQSQLSKIEKLPELVSAEGSLRDLSTDLGERAISLRRFDMDRLKRDIPTCKQVTNKKLDCVLRGIAKRGRLLASCHQRLREENCLISSFDELGDLQTRLTDEQKKLQGAKKVTEEKREALEIPCKVYLGKPLLIELPEKLTGRLSADELNSAQVVAAYDQTKEALANTVIMLVEYYKRLNDKLHSKIEQARGLASEEQNACSQEASNMRAALGGIVVKLQSVGCPEGSLPNTQTGSGLTESIEWVSTDTSRDWIQINDEITKAKGQFGNPAMRVWGERILPLLNQCTDLTKSSDGLLEQANKLTEAARSLTEHKERFKNLRDEVNGKENLKCRYNAAVGILTTYLDKLRFSEEDIDALTQRFLDFVREGKRFFSFNFDFQLDDKGNLILSRDGIDGPIQAGGGESQILGLLEMLAVATEFGFPIIIDEVENYLDSVNLRKALSFIFNETDVQMVVTSRDEALSSRLREWGIEHTAYRVTKEADGFTGVQRMEVVG